MFTPVFQSTRPIRGATNVRRKLVWAIMHFNPRAPYGARLCIVEDRPPYRYFNPRAPSGARLPPGLHHLTPHGFQSTRPIRGATKAYPSPWRQSMHFNPRAPYGARHGRRRGVSQRRKISIHAPHTGRDPDRPCGHLRNKLISIHAPHTGRDRQMRMSGARSVTFQSTRPIRGATCSIIPCRPTNVISIHAPHTGRDSKNA